MFKKIGIILFLLLSAQYGGRPQGAAPTGLAFAQLQDDGQPCPPECVTDSMEIVTWYPSPYNEYEELRLYPTQRFPDDCNNDKIGLMYYDHGGTPSFPDNDKMMICKGTLLGWQEVGGEDFWKFVDSSTSDIYYTKSGNVGIGTTSPGAKLHVGGTAGVDGIMFPDGTTQTTATRYTAISPVQVLSIGQQTNWTSVNLSSAVPASAKAAFINWSTNGNVNPQEGYIASNTSGDGAIRIVTAGNGGSWLVNGQATAILTVPQTLYYRMVSTGDANLYISVYGYME